MKLLKTTNTNTVKYCQNQLGRGLKLPTEQFVAKLHVSDSI